MSIYKEVKVEGLFIFVVSFFTNWAWQSLGKIPNPATGKIEKNLDMAEQIIEILQMLKEKTKGNLTSEEEKVLNSAISDLQLNYVDEKNKEKNAKGEPEKNSTKNSK